MRRTVERARHCRVERPLPPPTAHRESYFFGTVTVGDYQYPVPIYSDSIEERLLREIGGIAYPRSENELQSPSFATANVHPPLNLPVSSSQATPRNKLRNTRPETVSRPYRPRKAAIMADDSPSSTGAVDDVAVIAPEAAAAPKPKRVRTGCLTCRERHLKCDEGLPNCLNCKKSGKVCKRGIKLNFHFIDVKDPAILPPTADWSGMLLPVAPNADRDREARMEANLLAQCNSKMRADLLRASIRGV